LILFLMCGATAIIQAKLVSNIGTKGFGRVRQNMFSNILEQPPLFFIKNKASDLIAKFSIELAAIETALVFALPPLIMRFSGYRLLADHICIRLAYRSSCNRFNSFKLFKRGQIRSLGDALCNWQN